MPAVVLPYFSMLMTTFSGGRPSRSAADMMMRRLAWCDTNRSISAAGDVVALHDAGADLFGLAHGELEDRLAILLHVVQPLIDGFVRRRPQAAACRHAQRRPAAAVDLVREIDDAAAVGRRAHDDRARAVAEQHARRAIGVVDDARHDVGADGQRVLCVPAADHVSGRRQRVGEPRARGAEIEAPGACRRRSCPGRRHAVLGNIMSGVVVPTTMKSMSCGVRPACAIALSAASFARSDVATPGSTMWRSRMPVR